MTAYVGMPVIYVPRPGRRESEFAALVTAFYPGDLCDLVLFPPMAESYQQPKVPMMSEKFTSHVWKVPETAAMPPAEGAPVKHNDEFIDFITERLVSLEHRLAALEAKRGPGRPRKDEAA